MEVYGGIACMCIWGIWEEQQQQQQGYIDIIVKYNCMMKLARQKHDFSDYEINCFKKLLMIFVYCGFIWLVLKVQQTIFICWGQCTLSHFLNSGVLSIDMNNRAGNPWMWWWLHFGNIGCRSLDTKMWQKKHLTNLCMTPSNPWFCFSCARCCRTLERANFFTETNDPMGLR